MTEVYPSDQQLLNLIAEPHTGVEYIPTGQTPYYLHFRRMLHRLLLAASRANDLRVFDEGELNIGVKPGKFWVGTSLVSYPGSSGSLLADEKEAIYIYLDTAGNLVTDNYSGFPSMASGLHVRLAVISTSGGDITELIDARDHHSIALPGAGAGGAGALEGHIADDSLEAAESGSVHTNLGASSTLTLTLPNPVPAGTGFTFAVQAPHQLRIQPAAGKAIRDDNGATPGKYKWADAVGECLRIAADENGDWAVLAKHGVWSEQV